MQVKKQWLEPDMEQWIGSKLGKEYIKAIYCHPAYLAYMQSTSWEMPGWMNHRLELRLPEKNNNNLRYADDTTLMEQSEEELNTILLRVKEQSEKASLKLNTQRTKIMATGLIIPWLIDREKVETVTNFIFLGSKITANTDCSHEI